MTTSTPPTLRPMGVADLVDEIFRLYRRNFGLFLGVAAFVSLPSAILFVGGSAFINPALTDPSAFATMEELTPRDFADIFSGLAVIFIGLIVLVVTFPLLIGAITDATAKRYLGRQTTVGASLRVGLSRYLPILGSFLLIVLAVLGVLTVASIAIGIAIGIVGGIPAALLTGLVLVAFFVLLVWIAATWSLAPQAIVIEGTGPIAGLGRSARLVSGSRWRVIGINLLLSIIGLVLISVPSQFLALALMPVPLPYNLNAALGQLVVTLAEIVYWPIALGTITLLYFDFRVRKEGLDLALAAEGLPGAPASPAR